MLTKPLIAANCRQGLLHPFFVKTDAPGPLQLAAQLLDTYREAARLHQSATELEELASTIVNAYANRRFALALKKLLDERSTFSSLAEIDFPKLRAEALEHSARLIQSETTLPNVDNWLKTLHDELPANQLLATGNLYADLPENDCLLEFKYLNPTQLLNRYNLALVQAILLNAKSLDIHVETQDAPRLRRLFKYLRFFQLLATVESDDAEATASDCLRMHLVVDGPAAILDQSRRYGLQLAACFPAICALERWTMDAEVTWKNTPNVRLHLDQDSRLECPYHNFAAYVPDEIRLFHAHFQETTPDWKMIGTTPFLHGEGREIIFPDFTFQHTSEKLVHLEIFNHWHANGLLPRLAWLEKHPTTPLILAVARELTKNPEIQDALESSEWFAQFGFLYRDYPTCERTRRTLEKRLASIK